MSMFMASMREAAKNGELDGMGMFGAALKRDVADYERRYAEEAERRRFFPTLDTRVDDPSAPIGERCIEHEGD